MEVPRAAVAVAFLGVAAAATLLVWRSANHSVEDEEEKKRRMVFVREARLKA
jgi:hypothetical protein